MTKISRSRKSGSRKCRHSACLGGIQWDLGATALSGAGARADLHVRIRTQTKQIKIQVRVHHTPKNIRRISISQQLGVSMTEAVADI